MPEICAPKTPSHSLFCTALFRTGLLCIAIFTNAYASAEQAKNTAQLSTQSSAQSLSPWGGTSITATEYSPQKVVYDVHVKTVEEVESVLDRASHLSVITGADPFEQSIVLVLHGPELSFFAIKNYKKYKELMHRAQSLAESEVLKIKMCAIAAQSQGYAPDDIHGFVEMVPMGDAEIIRLQYEENHAYMQ